MELDNSVAIYYALFYTHVEMTDYYILLEDKDAYKQKKGWNPLAPAYSDDHILKGSLLMALSDSEARDTVQYFNFPLNYKKCTDPTLKLYCDPEDVRQLTEKQFKLLLGVKYATDRYHLLRTLQWAESLDKGDPVAVTIPTISAPIKGVIQYIGPLPGEEGTKFGVELLVC